MSGVGKNRHVPSVWKEGHRLYRSHVLYFAVLVVAGDCGAIDATEIGIACSFWVETPRGEGNIFDLYKFRSMTDGCDLSGRLLPDVEGLTPFGMWLRSTSLDE